MTQPTPPAPEDENAVKAKFKGWINEALDERAVALAAAEAEEEKNRKTNKPPTILQSLFGG